MRDWDISHARTMALCPGAVLTRHHLRDSDGRVATKPDQSKPDQERASGVEMEACVEACGAREGLAPVYRPRRAYHDAIVGYVTGWTAAHISQMLAIHHRRWPFIRIVTSADTRTPERASTQSDLTSRTLPLCDVSRRTTGDQRGGVQHHGDVGAAWRFVRSGRFPRDPLRWLLPTRDRCHYPNLASPPACAGGFLG